MQAKRICCFGGEVADKKQTLERIEKLLKSLSEKEEVLLLLEGKTPFMNLCRKAAEKLGLRRIEYQREGDCLFRFKKHGKKSGKSLRIDGQGELQRLFRKGRVFVELADICIFYCFGEYLSFDRRNTEESRTQTALRYAYFLKGQGKNLTIINMERKEKDLQ